MNLDSKVLLSKNIVTPQWCPCQGDCMFSCSGGCAGPCTGCLAAW